MMTIIAQYLFGSHARNDFSEQSDIDLLAVQSENYFSNKSAGKLNISFYPKSNILEAASAGDLFVMHIIREAKCVYDSEGFDKIFASKFIYKKDYSAEISGAIDLGWFIFNNAALFSDFLVLNKRISWCVRTVLIAKSAQEGDPIFTTGRLVARNNFVEANYLISRRNSPEFNQIALVYFEQFLKRFGEKAPTFDVLNTRDTWWHFFKSKNKIGMRTLKDLILKNQIEDNNDEDLFY